MPINSESGGEMTEQEARREGQLAEKAEEVVNFVS